VEVCETKLSFEDGEVLVLEKNIDNSFVTALKNTNKEIGPICVVVTIHGSTWALFQLDQLFIDFPREIEIRQSNCLFFERDMIALSLKFLTQQPKQELLFAEDTLFQLTADVQQLKLMMEEESDV
jgi:hypothetical protein